MGIKVILFSSVVAVCSCVMADLAKVGVLVWDDVSSVPIKDVVITGHFQVNNGWGAWKGAALPNKDTAITDVNRRCKLNGKTNSGGVGCHVDQVPSGYYLPARGGGRQFNYRNLFGIWQPDNMVVTIRLQRVGHPIPLLVKSLNHNGLGMISQDIFPKGGNTLRYDNPKSLDRNLEWDRKENLFHPGERVRSPGDKLP